MSIYKKLQQARVMLQKIKMSKSGHNKAVFSGFSGLFDIHWTMNCANDALSVDPILNNVPEPTSLALLMLGLGSLALVKRRNAGFMVA